MTKDLGNVVREAGGEDAFAAWHKANRLASLTKAQQNALSKIIGTKGDAPPEAVFNRLATFANSKRGADLNRLQLAKQAMGPAAWGEVGAATIDRLGMAPDGAFSPQRFVTAFGNMAPAARNELFSGQQHAALQDLFLVSKHIQDRITRFGNPSGTARGGDCRQCCHRRRDICRAADRTDNPGWHPACGRGTVTAGGGAGGNRSQPGFALGQSVPDPARACGFARHRGGRRAGGNQTATGCSGRNSPARNCRSARASRWTT